MNSKLSKKDFEAFVADPKLVAETQAQAVGDLKRTIRSLELMLAVVSSGEEAGYAKYFDTSIQTVIAAEAISNVQHLIEMCLPKVWAQASREQGN